MQSLHAAMVPPYSVAHQQQRYKTNRSGQRSPWKPDELGTAQEHATRKQQRHHAANRR